MSSLLLEPTSTAQWQSLVKEAEEHCSCQLGEDLESYLVFLLMRFLRQPQMAAAVMAMDYLNSQNSSGALKVDNLRDVGDKCLLFSGLFPQQAQRRLVKISYFVNLGRTAYIQLSDNVSMTMADLYRNVAQGFVPLMDVLQTVREMENGRPVLSALDAYELWQDTGSKKALHTVREATTATPVVEQSILKH